MDNSNEAKYLMEKLVNFNTENFDDKPGGYTLELLEFVKKYLAKSGIQSSVFPYTIEKKLNGQDILLNNRGILLSKPKNNNKPVILLEGHCDTIPLSEKNIVKPIFRIKQNQIIGRGSVDMKGSLVSMILAIKELAKVENLKYQPVLLITSDEEANNFAGIKYFIKQQDKHNLKIKLAICGEPTSFVVKTNFYGAMYRIIKFFGGSGHGAYSGKEKNAIVNSVFFLNKLMDYQNKVCKLYNSSFGYSTMNIGVIRGGEKVNQIPSSCVIEFAIRTVKNNKIYDKLFHNTTRDKNLYTVEKVFSYNPISVSAKDEIINVLKKILLNEGKEQKNKSLSVKEFTEATFLNTAGIKTIVFGPGDPAFSHTSFESINIKDILLYKNVLKKFFQSL